MEHHLLTSFLPTPREKILDIERRLVRPKSNQRQNVKMPTLYEECMERMTNKSYQLTAAQSAARRKSWQRISYPGRHRSTPPHCPPGYVANKGAHLLWSTVKKNSKHSTDEEVSVMNWPSEELKEMTSYLYKADRVSESYSMVDSVEGGPVACQASCIAQNIITNETCRSESSIDRSIKREMSFTTTCDHAENYKKLAEFDSCTASKPEHKGLSELKASPCSNTSWRNPLAHSDFPKYSIQVRWSESLGEYMEHEGPSNLKATNSSVTGRSRSLDRHHTSNSPRHKRIKAISGDLENK